MRDETLIFFQQQSKVTIDQIRVSFFACSVRRLSFFFTDTDTPPTGGIAIWPRRLSHATALCLYVSFEPLPQNRSTSVIFFEMIREVNYHQKQMHHRICISTAYCACAVNIGMLTAICKLCTWGQHWQVLLSVMKPWLDILWVNHRMNWLRTDSLPLLVNNWEPLHPEALASDKLRSLKPRRQKSQPPRVCAAHVYQMNRCRISEHVSIAVAENANAGQI